MALANDLYNYRRLAKPISDTNRDRPLANAGQFRLPKLPVNLREIEPERIKPAALQQAAADRVLYFTTIPVTYAVDADGAAVQLNNRGLEYLDFDLPRAFRCLRDAVKLDPGFALAWNNLGLVYLEIGDLEQAAKYFNKAIVQDETLDIAYGNAGLAHIEAGDYEAAWQHLDHAISLDPQEPIHYNSLGILCLELEYPHQAIQCFDLAIQLNPELPMPYHNRGRAYIQLGDYQQAQKDIDQAYRIDQAELQPAGAML